MQFIESEKIELKSQLSENIEKEIVAFLNYKEGGDIYIGVNDDGSINGIDDIDEV